MSFNCRLPNVSSAKDLNLTHFGSNTLLSHHSKMGRSCPRWILAVSKRIAAKARVAVCGFDYARIAAAGSNFEFDIDNLKSELASIDRARQNVTAVFIR